MENHQFKDDKGRVWSLVIRVAEYRMLREEHGIDIGNIFDQENSWMTKIMSQDDMLLLPLILHDLCRAQCVRDGVDDQDFFEGLGGDTLGQATQALFAAVANFIPAHKRAVMMSIVGNLEKGMAKTVEKVLARESQIQEILDQQIDQRLDQLMLNSLSTPQQESAE